jgi:beta-lactamase superfamily II metal-dependent hydrolase
MKRYIILASFFIVVTGALFYLGAYIYHFEYREHLLEVYFFVPDDNGTSMSTFIRTPNNKTILIDGGKTNSIIRRLSSLMPFYRRTIDTVIFTNLDDAHVTGLVSVLKRYKVGQVIGPASSADFSTPAASTTSFSTSTLFSYHALQNVIHDMNIKSILAGSGEVINIGDESLVARTIFPDHTFSFTKTNPVLFALTITFGSTTLVFAGDTSKNEQKFIMSKFDVTPPSSIGNQRNTILILPHGENKGALDESFFKSIHPSNVIVLKKLAKGPPGASRNPTDVTVSDKKATKKSKSQKPPFSIIDAQQNLGFSIVNLAQGDVSFSSDGLSFTKKED